MIIHGKISDLTTDILNYLYDCDKALYISNPEVYILLYKKSIPYLDRIFYNTNDGNFYTVSNDIHYDEVLVLNENYRENISSDYEITDIYSLYL